jgi:hypothetical protein
MGKSRGVEDVLDGLAALRGKPVTPEGRAAIIKALGSKHNIVAGKAADVARELKVRDICAELQQAFDRFLKGDPRDKGCAATTAIARAALELECDAGALFNGGIRHVQREGPYDSPSDAAAELRGLCALGLVMVRDPHMMEKAADLLADDAPTARIGAVRALAYSGREDAALVLRFKSLTGDDEPDVISECFAALFQLAPDRSLEFVGKFLDSSDEATRENAALAIGASRQPEALAMLRSHYSPRMWPGLRATLLLAIATVRSPEAVQFLLSVAEQETPEAAVDAVRALSMFRHDHELREKLAGIVENRGDERLRRALAEMTKA